MQIQTANVGNSIRPVSGECCSGLTGGADSGGKAGIHTGQFKGHTIFKHRLKKIYDQFDFKETSR